MFDDLDDLNKGYWFITARHETDKIALAEFEEMLKKIKQEEKESLDSDSKKLQ